jgi:hypothetical protein
MTIFKALTAVLYSAFLRRYPEISFGNRYNCLFPNFPAKLGPAVAL